MYVWCVGPKLREVTLPLGGISLASGLTSSLLCETVIPGGLSDSVFALYANLLPGFFQM